MTKQEILTNIFDPDEVDCRSTLEDLRTAIILNPSIERIERAMDEYAMQQSIGFGEYIQEQMDANIIGRVLSQKSKYFGMWTMYEVENVNVRTKYLTTRELYQLYLNSKK